MKRILILLLLLTLLSACGEEAAPDTTIPSLPTLDIEQMNPPTNQTCSAELNFAEALPAGAVVELLDGETVVASCTVEATTYIVRLSGDKLRPDVSYSLKVNGVLQQHSGMITGRPGSMTPPINEIPEPSQPPVEEAPATEGSGGFTPGGGNMGGGSMPPDGFSIGELPPEGMEPPMGEPNGDFFNGQLPPEPPEFSGSLEIPDSPIPSGGQIPGKGQEQSDPTEFRLVGASTGFYGICPAN